MPARIDNLALVRVVLALLVLGCVPLRAEMVHTTDGKSLEGSIVSLDDKQLIFRTPAGEQKLPLATLRHLTFDQRPSPDPLARSGQHLLLAEDTSRLALKDAKITDGKLTAASDLVPAFTVPVESLTRLYRPRAHEKPADLDRQVAAAKLTRTQQDTLLVNSAGDDWVTVTGLLTALSADKLTFSYEGAESAMDASTVPLIEFAQLAKAPQRPSPIAILTGTDGSRLAVVSLKTTGKELRATTPALGTLTLAPAAIAALRFQSSAATYLSDLAPASVTQTPFFDESFPHRKDASVAGTPLSLARTTYEKGLGLHARCQLTFDLAGAYKQLTALAGIDDAVRTGSATLTILADDRPLLRTTTLQAGRPPQSLRLDLTNVKTLILRTDFAPNTYGAGARINLCDPVLTK